jgi:hypothetical protein
MPLRLTQPLSHKKPSFRSADIPTLGSRLETQVSVIFRQRASPEVEEVEVSSQGNHANMYYVTNLTVWAAQDDELNRHTVTCSEVKTARIPLPVWKELPKKTSG